MELSKVDLLFKPYWSTKDIANYYNTTLFTARKIKKAVVDSCGDKCLCPFNSKLINANSILKKTDLTTRQEEINKMGLKK